VSRLVSAILAKLVAFGDVPLVDAFRRMVGRGINVARSALAI
jgi:hypothetical protein